MANEVILRDVEDSDLSIFFEQQRDPDGFRMAGFTATDPQDREAYLEKWAEIRRDPRTIMRTILFNGRVAGDILSFEAEPGRLEVGYWLDKAFWGQGIATRALAAFLAEITARPLHARVVKDNAGSLRVLEKCGFTITGEAIGFANARDEEVELYLLTLE
jgi:RimJ/RimL family protein N-acetyltransferase